MEDVVGEEASRSSFRLVVFWQGWSGRVARHPVPAAPPYRPLQPPDEGGSLERLLALCPSLLLDEDEAGFLAMTFLFGDMEAAQSSNQQMLLTTVLM